MYVDLDFESRYLGKEVINMLANRLGKSVIAATLAIASYSAGNDEDILSKWFFICCHAVTWVWLFLSFQLSSLKLSVGTKVVS